MNVNQNFHVTQNLNEHDLVWSVSFLLEDTFVSPNGDSSLFIIWKDVKFPRFFLQALSEGCIFWNIKASQFSNKLPELTPQDLVKNC